MDERNGMSREQWGHGFHRGVDKGIELAQSENPKYCVTFVENKHIECIYIVQEIHGDIYILEAIPYMWFICNGFAEPSKYPIEPENVYETRLDELNNPKLFYKWESVVKAFIADEKLYRKQEQNNR